jgi:hypothetical protein
MKKTSTILRVAFFTNIFALVPLFSSIGADAGSASAANALTQSTQTAAPVITATPAPARVPYGVEDVVKLSRAQIGEEVILNYVQSSGTIYNLAPKDIVYLHDQGVSEKVINAMIDQRKRVEFAAQNVAPTSPSAPNAQTVPNAPLVPNAATAPAAPSYTDPNATYASAPLTPPASSVYVVPYNYSYYGPYAYGYGYPYYYGGWWAPSVSFGFRFGGYGGYRGGYYGGHGSYAGRGYGGHRR